MTREEIGNREEDMIIDNPKPKIQNPDEFNVNYLRIYYGKFLKFLTF